MLKNEIKSYQKPIFFDCKGSIDDYIALMSLLTLDKYSLTGIVITPVFCDSKNSIELILKILDLFCRHDIQIAISNIEPVNEYTKDENFFCAEQSIFEELLTYHADTSKISKKEAADFTAETILNTDAETIVIATGSAANLVSALDKYPEAAEKIERILWVAGAFLTDGDVIAPDHDGSAEWNIFSHPHAAEKLLNFEISKILFPLDTVNQYPADSYLMYHLENNKDKKLSALANTLLKPCFEKQKSCYLGSVMPTVYLGMPGLFQLESKSIKVELRGTSMGNIYRTSLGSRVKQASCIDEELFYDCLLAQLDHL